MHESKAMQCGTNVAMPYMKVPHSTLTLAESHEKHCCHDNNASPLAGQRQKRSVLSKGGTLSKLHSALARTGRFITKHDNELTRELRLYFDSTFREGTKALNRIRTT